MSYDVWGDDGAGDYDHLIEGGWWPSEQAEAVHDAIKALIAEPIYEGGDKANGVSTRFLMRLTVLQAEACILTEDDPMVREARTAIVDTHPQGQDRETGLGS